MRAQVIAGLVYERDSITSQATTIGELENRRPVLDADEGPRRPEAVTPADIQKAAQTFFTCSACDGRPVPPENPAEGAQP